MTLRLHLCTITHPSCIGALLASWDALGVFQRSPGVLAGTLDRLALAETALSPSLTSGGRCWSGTDSTGAIFVTRTSRPRTAANRSRCTSSERSRFCNEPAAGGASSESACSRRLCVVAIVPATRGAGRVRDARGRLKTPVPSRPGRGRDRRHGVRVSTSPSATVTLPRERPVVPPPGAGGPPACPESPAARSRAFKSTAVAGRRQPPPPALSPRLAVAHVAGFELEAGRRAPARRPTAPRPLHPRSRC